MAASETVLPISYPSLAGTGLAPGSQVFVGQYLFTGSETSSVYLTVQEVSEEERAGGKAEGCGGGRGGGCVEEGVVLCSG